MSDHRLDHPHHQFIISAGRNHNSCAFLHFMTVTFCILPQSYHDKRDEIDKNEDL